jgi:hypothetical protein
VQDATWNARIISYVDARQSGKGLRRAGPDQLNAIQEMLKDSPPGDASVDCSVTLAGTLVLQIEHSPAGVLNRARFFVLHRQNNLTKASRISNLENHKVPARLRVYMCPCE